MYKDALEQSGLKPGEAKVYDILLQYGHSPASELVKKANFKRGMTYKFLDDLKTKGLVTSFKKNKKTYFKAEHPHKLLQDIEDKLKEYQTQRISLEAAMPSLESSYLVQETKPTVIYYEDTLGLKKVFADIYSPKEEVVYGCVDLEIADKAIPEYISHELIPLRIKNKVKAISFIADSPTAKTVHEKDAVSFRKSVLLDKKKYPIPAEIDVYENKIAMLSFNKGKFVGILIENADIARSLKSIFKLAFENSKRKS